MSDKDQNGEGLAFFFLLHYFKTAIAGVRQPGDWVPEPLGYRSTYDLLSEMQTATRGYLLQEFIGKLKSKYQVQGVNYLNYTGLG